MLEVFPAKERHFCYFKINENVKDLSENQTTSTREVL